jgi:hypothetical protein
MVLISPISHTTFWAKSEAGPAGNGLTNCPPRAFSASTEAAKIKREAKNTKGRNEYMVCSEGKIGSPFEETLEDECT